MKVTLDQGRCVGSRPRVVAAPDVVDQCEEDGIAVLLDADPPSPPRAQRR
jgi:ferredoxin